MILRRVTEHVKAQNWFAVFLDFVIVVVGVFVGIQVANWNEARKDHREEAVILSRLLAEARAAHEQIQTYRTRHERIDVTTVELIARLEDPAVCSVADSRMQDILLAVGDFPPPNFSLPTVDELVLTGRLSLIRDAALRDEIGTIAGQMDFITRQWTRYVAVKQYVEKNAYQTAGLSVTKSGALPDEGYDGQGRFRLRTPDRLCNNPALVADVANAAMTEQVYIRYIDRFLADMGDYRERLRAYAERGEPVGDAAEAAP